MYFVCMRVRGESYCRRFRSLLLYLCYVFRALNKTENFSLSWAFVCLLLVRSVKRKQQQQQEAFDN